MQVLGKSMDRRTADPITPEISRSRSDRSTLVKVPITIWAEGRMGEVCQPSSTQIPPKVDSAYQVLVQLCNCSDQGSSRPGQES